MRKRIVWKDMVRPEIVGSFFEMYIVEYHGFPHNYPRFRIVEVVSERDGPEDHTRHEHYFTLQEAEKGLYDIFHNELQKAVTKYEKFVDLTGGKKWVVKVV